MSKPMRSYTRVCSAASALFVSALQTEAPQLVVGYGVTIDLRDRTWITPAIAGIAGLSPLPPEAGEVVKAGKEAGYVAPHTSE